MKLLRSEVIDRLLENGDSGTAQLVAARFPEEVDTERDSDLLDECGVDPDRLWSR